MMSSHEHCTANMRAHASIFTSCSSDGNRRTRCSSSGRSDYICHTENTERMQKQVKNGLNDFVNTVQVILNGSIILSKCSYLSIYIHIPHQECHIHPPGS